MSSRKYYPIALDLCGRRTLVVGGGRVAERKVRTLLRFRAAVQVVAPGITPVLKAWARDGKIAAAVRPVREGDLKGVDLVIAATNDRSVNARVRHWGRKHRAWVNVVDSLAQCDFIAPAVFVRGPALVAVHTNGRDPALSRDLKNFIKEKWDAFISYRR